MNAKGEEALRRRLVEERTSLDRHALRMTEKREETWRPLNRRRATAFIQMFLLAMVDKENAFRSERQKNTIERMLVKALVKRVIPFIHRRLVWTMDDSM